MILLKNKLSDTKKDIDNSEETSKVDINKGKNWLWRMSLLFKTKKTIAKELDTAIEAEDIDKLEVLMFHSRALGSLSLDKIKSVFMYVWQQAVKDDKKQVQKFIYERDDNVTNYSSEERAKYFMLLATARKDYKSVKALLELGLDPNYELDSYYMKPHMRNDIPLHMALRNNDKKMVQLLLENGADVNFGAAIKIPIEYITKKPSKLGNISEVNKFHRNIKYARECLDLLLAKKPFINFRNAKMLAKVAEAKDAKLMEKLLEAGGDIELAAQRVVANKEAMAFIRPYLEEARAGWHLTSDKNIIVKSTYIKDSAMTLQEVFNFYSETKITRLGNSAPSEISFKELAEKQIEEAAKMKDSLLKKKSAVSAGNKR